MSEEKDPASFDEFFKGGLDSIKKAADQRIEADLAPARKRMGELREMIAAAQAVSSLLESSGWSAVAWPWMTAQSAAAMRPWKPGDPVSKEEVDAQYFYSSGRASFTNDLLAKFKQVTSDGVDAQRELAHLEREEEKRKKG